MFALRILKNIKIFQRFDKSFYGSLYREGEVTNEVDTLYKEIVLTIRGHDDQVLNSYRTFVATVCEHFELNFNATVRNTPYYERLVLNSCPFVHKKTFREYEIRTHEHVYTIPRLTGCTASVFLEYIQRNLPEGVGMYVEKHRLESFPDHLLHVINSASIDVPNS